MNNKQLFEQSAGKILSKNQLEGVMRLHAALFECGDTEQVAETVATAVKDALDDSLETVADQKVADDVAEAASIKVNPEDKVKLESLINSMSDHEKMIFVESLDDQQVQILTEGFGSAVKSLFKLLTKEGRLNHRINKFGNLASKEADVTNRLNRLERLGNGNVSSGNAKTLNKLRTEQSSLRRQMNDMRFKAGNREGTELDELNKIGRQNGSFNFNADELEKFKGQELSTALKNHNSRMSRAASARNKDADVVKLNSQRKQELDAIDAKQGLTDAERSAERNAVNKKYDDAIDNTPAGKKYKQKVADSEAKYNADKDGIEATYENHINMAHEREAGFGGFNNGAGAGAGRSAFGGGRARFNNGYYGGQYGFPYHPYMTPEAWHMFTRRYSTMGKVARTLVGSWKAFTAALKLGTLGALGYGGYKIYEIFAHPEEMDAKFSLGGGDAGSEDGNNNNSVADTVKKVLFILGGGAAGNIGARFLGFNSTTGKTVGTLLGAALVAYFMFLNGGDEENAKEMLDEYNNASDTDRQAINEALDINGLGEALQGLQHDNT